MAVKLDSSKDIYRGELFVFAKPDGSESDEPLAFATTATLEITTEYFQQDDGRMGRFIAREEELYGIKRSAYYP